MGAQMSDELTRPNRRQLLKLAGASVVSGMAGCSQLTPDLDFEATPVGLSAEGMALLNRDSLDHEAVTVEREVPAVDETVTITSHAVAYGTTTEGEAAGVPESPFPVTDRLDRNMGVLATPAVEIAGMENNPLATQPLGEIIAGDRGRRLLGRIDAVESPDFEWSQQPEQVATSEAEVFGTATTIQSFFGAIHEEDGPDTLLLLHATRVEREADVVIVGNARTRSASGVGGCVEGSDSEFTIVRDCVDQTIGDFTTGLERLGPCPGPLMEIAGTCQQFTPEDDPRESWRDWPNIDIGDLRLVQKVEDTRVVGGSYIEGSPDLVEPENTAPLFEFRNLSNLSNLPNTIDIKVTVYKDDGSVRGPFDFRISDANLTDIESGTSEIAIFHDMANDNDSQNDLPVFRLVGDDDAVEVEVAPNASTLFGDTARISNLSPTSVGPLKVGFMQIRDSGGGSSHPNTSPGDNYGDANGWVRDYQRTVNTVIEYLQRTYPGPVIGYRHDQEFFWGGMTEDDDGDGDIDEEGDATIKSDLRDVRKHLDTVANRSAFPQGRVYRSDYHSQGTSESIISNNGFDATVAIVPNDVSSNPGGDSYFGHHGKSWGGVYWGHSRAVAVTGGSPTGQGRWISVVGAQEVGHYFQSLNYEFPSGHPLAQRADGGSDTTLNNSNNTPIDLDHARHQNSDMLDRDVDGDGTDENFPPDAPGVASVAYDLEDGTFNNVQAYVNPDGNFEVATGPATWQSSVSRLQSFMSYDNDYGELWTDARIHQDMIDSNWTWPNQSGSTSAGAVLSAAGRVVDDGTIEYDDVAAYEGFPRYVDHEEAPVRVSLVDPNDETLESVRVPDRFEPSHAEDGVREGFADFLLPFPREVAAVRTEYDGSVSEMNPIVRSVGDAVGRVPDRGFTDEPGARRETIQAILDEIEARMAEKQYEAAAETMETDLLPPVQSGFRDDYSEAINDPEREELVVLVEDMIDRLQTLAGSS